MYDHQCLRAVVCTAIALWIRPAVAINAEHILQATSLQGGLIVHIGCGDGTLTTALRAQDGLIVHGIDTEWADVEKARRHIQSLGLYGSVSADHFDGKCLPYTDNLVNLIVAEDLGEVPMDEVMRVLCPDGIACVREKDTWKKTVKPRPDTIDEWTHYFHGPDGNPVAKDTQVGPPRCLQWVGSPRWSRHHDHMASMTALVAAGGRLFYILDEGPTASIQLPSQWRLIARDAFNGTVLWKRPIDSWNTHQYPLKSGPAHLLRRLVAVGNRVYCTLGLDAPVSILDAATGQVLGTCEGSDHTREIVVSEDVAFLVADSNPSKLPEWRRESSFVWDNTQRANTGWGWIGDPRRVLACDTKTGQLLWEVEAPVAPCSLAVDGKRVIFQDGKQLICLDRTTGQILWESEAAPTRLPVVSSTGPRILIYQDVVLFAGNDGKMSGWSAIDGKKIWEQKHKPSGHQSLKDLFIVDGLVWTGAIAAAGDDGSFTGYDPFTGEVKKQFEADVHLHWFHHRCYPAKAAGKYLLTARNGTEFVDIRTGHWEAHHWVRGGCIYGVLPCNGMMYAPMHSCGCQLEAKLTGFNALAPELATRNTEIERHRSQLDRLEKGPAFGLAMEENGPDKNRLPEVPDPGDWPMYRHDSGRSGTTASPIPVALGPKWSIQLGGRLTPPVIAAGILLTASIDGHTLYALDAETGERRWAYTAGGRIDSAPTCFQGLVLFGSADGYLYALRAADGQCAWRFRGAPSDRRLMAWEQIESTWPVHGSVLIHDGVLYCTAGRNMYLDGGIHFLRLDPMTGKLLGETVMNDIDPETGQDMQLAHLKKTQDNNMPVALSDILSCDGRHIWMRSQKFDLDGNRLEIGLKNVREQPAQDCHLFCQIGFLDDSSFFRGYWTYGRRVSGGYGGWFQAGRLVPSGRILCYDNDYVYGFGRKLQYMVNASVLEYQLFAADKVVTAEAMEALQRASNRINARSTKKRANASDWRLRSFFPVEDLTATRFEWTIDQPAVLARAMCLAGDTLFVAGPHDVVDERQVFHMPDDPEMLAKMQYQAESLAGQHGGQLWAVAKSDGKVLARYVLDTVPVFDGMAAARKCLYMTTLDGRVLCLADQTASELPRVTDQPLRVRWDEPEDPAYLAPSKKRQTTEYK
ncbi:MAG: PQQ-binding-like beta-propeller repeat protein [Pirellulales bacterium]|nr:PQQ-binding-like beta-propeller repeat protein [Pirellulales bacterium]